MWQPCVISWIRAKKERSFFISKGVRRVSYKASGKREGLDFQSFIAMLFDDLVLSGGRHAEPGERSVKILQVRVEGDKCGVMRTRDRLRESQ
jgi:hypothetical protein